MTAEDFPAFESQQLLVSRLTHLFGFSFPFAFLSGAKGSGRTSLCLQWLASSAAPLHSALITCTAGMTASRLREQLFNRLLPGHIFDPDDALSDTLFRLHGAVRGPLVIVIDDADLAPEGWAQELWELYCINAALPQPLQLGVLLCGVSEWVTDTVKGLVSPSLTPLELDLEPLSSQEQTALLEHCLRRADYYALMPNPAALAEKLRHCAGNPGRIVALAEEIMNRKSILKKKEWPANKVMASAGVVAAVVLLLSWVIPPLLRHDTAVKPQPVAPTPASSAEATVISAAQSVATSVAPATLPDEVSGANDISAQEEADKRRVVIADQVVRDIMASQAKGQPVVSAASDTHAVAVSGAVTSVDQLQPLVSELTSAPASAAAPTKASANKPVTPTVQGKANAPHQPKAPPVSAAVVAGSNAELASKPVRHFAIQLAAGGDEKAVRAYVAKQKPTARYWIYQTEYQGKPWFVLVQGDYASSAQARAAISGLPAGLKAGHPWPKSFGQIQKEMK